MSEELLIIDEKILAESEKRFCTKLINSLAGIRSVALIGTKSNSGEENLAIFNSLVHLGANPALFGLITRPDSVERHTLENILETKSYTLNFIDKKWRKKAHQTSARYPKQISEFDAVNLTPEYFGNCFSPFVLEAEIKVEMKFEQILDIEINGTKMIIGSIQKIILPKNRVEEDGLVNFGNILLSGGLNAYYDSNFLEQLPYAKP